MYFMKTINLQLPNEEYQPLSIQDVEYGIKYIKDTFEQELAKHLHLTRVSAPLFLPKGSGLNDNLNGVEIPVTFTMKDLNDSIEIIHSLAKWKRVALQRYQIQENQGLYTDMNAIRKDEDLDNLHSAYVDQWDWEKHIAKADRTLQTLKHHVLAIHHCLMNTQSKLLDQFPQLKPVIASEITFLTTQELEDLYPNLTPKEREYEIVKQHKFVCLMQIGDQLQSGNAHDGRSPDYDDWSLNCDLLIYYSILDCVVELSSMGIRVDETSLQQQLEKADCMDRLELDYHQSILQSKLPYSIGGGIGQSRICFVLLNRAHIGEVQVSLWPDEMYEACKEHQISLL